MNKHPTERLGMALVGEPASPSAVVAHATCPAAHEGALGASVGAALQAVEPMLEPTHV